MFAIHAFRRSSSTLTVRAHQDNALDIESRPSSFPTTSTPLGHKWETTSLVLVYSNVKDKGNMNVSGILTNEEKQGSQGFKNESTRPHKVEPQGVAAGTAPERAIAALAILRNPRFHRSTPQHQVKERN